MTDQGEAARTTITTTSSRPGIQWRAESEHVGPASTEGLIEPLVDDVRGFSAHAGEVMASPRVFAIYWGRDYGTPQTGMNARAAAMDTFFTMILTSTYVDNLGQYSVGRGTFLGSTWIDHDPATAQTFNPDQMTNVLVGWLDAGLAPQVPASNELDLLFVIFPPAEVTLTIDGRTDFCGYHYWGKYHKPILQKDNLFFAVVDTSGGTGAVSHELVEAFTDRSHNGWYSDEGDQPEIGDVCSSCGHNTVSLGGFPLASYWMVNHGRCLQQFDLTPFPSAIVPNVVGDIASAAVKAIKLAGFVVERRITVDNSCNNIGDVVSQSPGGGSERPTTSVVTIWVGTEPSHPCP